MSHFILVCGRGGRPAAEGLTGRLEACAQLLWPPGTRPAATKIVSEGALSLAVAVPADGLPLHGASLCLGRFLDTPGEWWRPGTTPPDGTYALCRSSPDAVELVTDIAASRAVWYYHDDEVFLASSSQRPLIALLGGFELDPEAVTWMVASRSLGPRPSYDRRLKRAPLDGAVRLDRHSWALHVTARWSPYEADDLPDDEHARRLHDAIVETCSYLAPDAERWPLLLSGGYDSRALLVGMRQAGITPSCVTWGLESALRDESSDAAVARRLAASVAVPHEFFALDGKHDLAVAALEEFIVRSEGQVQDFTMYVDGFATWRTLADRGCIGVIRGDNYPWAYLGEFISTRTVRHHCGADLLADYSPGHAVNRLGLTPQSWPSSLEQRPDEDLLRYRDRLQRTLYIPARVAPLNQIKASYTEIVNPLKARRIADVVMRLPERLRLHPGVLARVLELHGPAVPFAKRPAATLPGVLEWPEMRQALAEGLSSDSAQRLYDGAAIADVISALLRPPEPATRSSATHRLRAMLPRKVKDMMLPVVGVRLDTRELALRMVIAARAVRLFEDDAGRLGGPPLPVATLAAKARA